VIPAEEAFAKIKAKYQTAQKERQRV